MTQSNDLPSRMSRAEDNIIDLRLAASALLQATDKNSSDIAALIEVSHRNNEQIAILRDATADLQASQIQTEEAIRDIRAVSQRIEASIERMDRLFDYLIRRDQGQPE